MTQRFITRADQATSSGTPLRKVKGRFDGWQIQPIDSYGRVKVDLQLNELEVLESVTPYMYPAATITVTYGENERSAWVMMLKSAEDLGVMDIEEAKGKTVTMENEHNHRYGINEETKEPIEGDVWRFVEIEGAGSGAGAAAPVDTEEHILALIDGKDKNEFAQASLQDAVARTMSSEIIDGSLVAKLIADGKLEEVDGRYKRVGAAATA